MSMPKLLQLALPFKTGLQIFFSGSLDATGEALSSSWATKLQRTKWDWTLHQFSYKRMTSEGLNRASVSLQPVSSAEPIFSGQSEVIFGKAPGTVLFSGFSTASILGKCRLATAPLPSHDRHPPTFLLGDRQCLPTTVVRHHMGGHDHHGPGIHGLNSENKNAAEAIERISRIGLWSDVLLTFGKGAAGWISGSTAIIADAVHSVSDIGPSAVTLWLVRTGILPADKKFPYGRGKFEAVGAFGISVVLLVTGCGTAWHAFEVLQSNVPLREFVHAAWDSLGSTVPADATASADAVANSQVSSHANHEHHNHSHGGLFPAHHHGIDESHLWVAVSAAVVSIGVKEALFWSTKAIGDRNGSSLIQASAWHHRSDAIASMVALVGVGGAWLGVPWLDPVASIFVSGMIVRAGTAIGKRSLQELTDEGIQEDGLAPIRATVLSVQGVEGCHALRGRKMGSCLHIDLHIKVDPNIRAVACRDIRDAVKRAVQQSHRGITDILVQVDPADGQPITLDPAEAEFIAGNKSHPSCGPSSRGISRHDQHHHHYHTWASQYDRGMSPITGVVLARGSRIRLHSSVATIRNRKASTLLASAAAFGMPRCSNGIVEHREYM